MRVCAESVSWNAPTWSSWQTFSSASAVTHTTLYTRFKVRVCLRYFGNLEEVTFFLFCDHIGPNADASQPQRYFYKAKPTWRSAHMIVKWTSLSVWFRKKPRFTSKVGRILFPGFHSVIWLNSVGFFSCFYCVGPRCHFVMTSCCTEDVHTVGDWYPRCWSR